MSKVVTYWGCCVFYFIFFIFSYLSFAVHLPLLHEYRTIFRLTFSSAWRNRRWWKFMESWNLSKNNSSVGAALGSAPSRKKSPHRTRPLPLTASAVSKCNWNIMCQTGYHSRHYAALKGALRWPFRQRMQVGDRSGLHRSGLHRSGSCFLFFWVSDTCFTLTLKFPLFSIRNVWKWKNPPALPFPFTPVACKCWCSDLCFQPTLEAHLNKSCN